MRRTARSRSSEGDLIVLAIHNDREWKRLCSDVVGKPLLACDPRFVTNPLRVQHREELHAALNSVFSTWSTQQMVDRLDGAQIANARINTVKEFLNHPQLAVRDAWREVGSPNGPIKAMLPPVRMEGVAPAMGPVPAVGQHSEAILREFGFDSETIAKWKREEMI